MTLHYAIFLFFAGLLAGSLNAVAGGGSFVAFPALLLTGVPAIPANATNTLAMTIGLAASSGTYRKRLDVSRRVMIPLVLTSMAGALVGALLLVRTPARTFILILPWLMLAATLLFAFGKTLTGRIRVGVARDASNAAIAGASVFELVVGVYGGYFGGGMGIMNLAMLVVIGMTDIHAMNALRLALSSAINGVATVTFVAAGAIYWREGLVMTAGAVLGGYASGHLGQKLPEAWIRAFVILVGATVTAAFFVKAYL